MRQAIAVKQVAPRRRMQEPLVEGVIEIPRAKDGKKLWGRLSDEQLIAHTRALMRKHNISGRWDLGKLNGSIYQALARRGLMEEVGFKPKNRNWTRMGNDEILEQAKTFIEKKGIISREELRKTDCGLCQVLSSRRLLERLFDEANIERKYIEGTSIPIDKRGRKIWREVDDDTIVKYIQQVMEKHRLTRISMLQAVDNGLYQVVKARKLYSKCGFRKRRTMGRWKGKSDEQIIEEAEKTIEKNGIMSRTELIRVDRGLYDILRERKLFGKLGFRAIKKQRKWSKMTDDEVIEYAKKVVEEEGLKMKSEIHGVDSGLYSILLKRKILDRVFEEIKKADEMAAAEQMFAAVQEM